MSSTKTEPKIVLGPEMAGTLMTPDEFDSVEEWDELYRYELIHGVLVVTPLPGEAEVDPNEELGYLLRAYHEHHRKGPSLDVTLTERYIRTEDSRRRADRVIWAGLGRIPDPTVDVPTIAVEFVSTAKRDRQRDYVERKKEYRAVGIQEYWIIDRFRRVLAVFRNKPTGVEELHIRENQTYRTPHLLGFKLPLARILAVADRWTQ